MKILTIEKCLDIGAVADRLNELNLGTTKNLFVLVLRFLENLDAPTALQRGCFVKIFNDNRPVILQFDSPETTSKVFVKNYKAQRFEDLSAGNRDFSDIRGLKEILKVHGRFDGDLLASELFEIHEDFKFAKQIAGSALCLRVMNLFDGGCRRIIPWKTAGCVEDLQSMKAYLAFIDYPFDPVVAVEHAWQSQRYDLLEIFIARDFPFPKGFDLDQNTPGISRKFKQILEQRLRLHETIANQEIEQVSRILDEIQGNGQVKRAYNKSNDSAMATCLRHFNPDVFALLLQKNLQFCEKCEVLMKNLPDESKRVVAEKNMEFFKPLTDAPDNHHLMSKCRLATGHFKRDFYSEKINKFLCELEKETETSQLLKVVDKCGASKIVFDFKHTSIGFMDPCHKNSFELRGLCFRSGALYIASKMNDPEVLDTLVREITHHAMTLIYRNECRPFPRLDAARTKEYAQVLDECREAQEILETANSQTINALYIGQGSNSLDWIALIPQLAIQHTNHWEAVQATLPKLSTYYHNYIPTDIEEALKKSSDQRSFRVNQNFVQTVEFENLTANWISDRRNASDFKILRVLKCPKAETTAMRLNGLGLTSMNSLFVLILDFEVMTRTYTELDANEFVNVFKDSRPVILQMNFNGVFREEIFVKDYLQQEFDDLFNASDLEEMLYVYGSLKPTEDILAAKLFEIGRSSWSEHIIGSVLCLRVINLFDGGCSSVTPWLTTDRVRNSRHLEAVLAFLDYPFEPKAALELAKQRKRLDLVEVLSADDYLSPQDFKETGEKKIEKSMKGMCSTS